MEERKRAGRRIVKVRAVLAMEGQAPLQGRTTEVGVDGVSVALERPLRVGQAGHLGFDLLVEGRRTPIAARARVHYCVFGSGEFRAGLQFLHLDTAAASDLARFLR